MKQVLTITFILLCSFSYSQDWREDTVSLHGKVKSIRYQSTLYFGEDEEDWRKKDNLYEYNENGFLIKEDLSNSLIGANYNSTYRIYNKENTLCMEEYFLFRKDTSSRHIFFTMKQEKQPEKLIIAMVGTGVMFIAVTKTIC